MYADHIGSESFHFGEIVDDGFPFGVPEVLDEAAGVSVVQTPRSEGLRRIAGEETGAAGRDANGGQGRSGDQRQEAG
jgi:hypothetical protein